MAKYYAYINRLRNYINDIISTPVILLSIVNDKNAELIICTLAKIKNARNEKVIINNI